MNNTGVGKVSSAMAKAIYKFLREDLEINGGIYFTTRKLYTVYDAEVINQEPLQKKINKKRIRNINYVHQLRECNVPSLFNASIEAINNSEEFPLIIINTPEIRAILSEIDSKEIADLFIDYVIVTMVPYESGYFLNADFINFTL